MLDFNVCPFTVVEPETAAGVLLSYLGNLDTTMPPQEVQKVTAAISPFHNSFSDFVAGTNEELFRLSEKMSRVDRSSRMVILWYLACSGDQIATVQLTKGLVGYRTLLSQCGPDIKRHLEEAISSWAARSVIGAAEDDYFSYDPDETTQELPPTLTVVPSIGDPKGRDGADISRRYGPIIGTALPYKGETGDISVLYDKLMADYPWAGNLVDIICGQLALLQCSTAIVHMLKIPPILLAGKPGCGKTRFLSDICKHLNLPISLIPCGGTADSGGLLATPRGWSSTRPCGPVQAIMDNRCANPGLILDELDKASTPDNGGQNGNVSGALLTMINGEKSFYDASLMASVDISAVSYLATANDISKMPEALMDRFMVVHMDSPTAEHFEAIYRGIQADEAKRIGAHVEDLPVLDEWELQDLAEKLSGEDASIRQLQKTYRIMLGAKSLERINAEKFEFMPM